MRGAFLLPVLFLVFSTKSIWAQQTPPPPKTEAPSTAAAAAERVGNAPVTLFVMLEKKSIVFPDIAATPAELSTGQKFKLFVDNSVSLHELFGASLGSGINQALDTPSGYGQGTAAYGKRFGSSMARLASSNFFGTFVLASALHQDPRFFPQKSVRFPRAVKYSFERVVKTRSDDGRDVINWSGLLGPLLSEGLANSYFPDHDRTVHQTFQRYGTDLAVRVGTNILREYWPIIVRKVRVKAHPPATSQ